MKQLSRRASARRFLRARLPPTTRRFAARVTRRRALTTVLFALALAPGGAARVARGVRYADIAAGAGAGRAAARTWLVVTRAQYARPRASQFPRSGELLGVGMLLHPTGERKAPWLRVYARHGKAWVSRANVRPTEPPLWWTRRQRQEQDTRRRGATPVVVVTPTQAPAPLALSCATVECAPLAAIHWAAQKWGQSEAALDAVARCESGYNPAAQNPSGSSGLFQFMPTTYWAYAPRIGETRSYWSSSGSANVAAYMFSLGQAGQWVCARILGLA